MLIAQITDIHLGFEPGVAEEANLKRLRALLDRLARAPQRPDLLLLTGDLTEHGERASYVKLAEVLAGQDLPFALLVGNHDDRVALREVFPQFAGSDGFVHYAIDGEGFRILVLDTLEPGRHGGAFCEARARWLDEALRAAPDTPTLIALHHPPFETGIAWLDTQRELPWIARLGEALSGHGQVVGLVCGHMHRTICAQWQGHVVRVCGSSAAAVALDLTPIDPETPDARAMITAEPPVYALHRWDGQMLVTHVEALAGTEALVRYDANFQPLLRQVAAENAGE